MALRVLLSLKGVFHQQQSQQLQAGILWGCQEQQLRFKRKNNKHWPTKWKPFRRLKVLSIIMNYIRSKVKFLNISMYLIAGDSSRAARLPGRWKDKVLGPWRNPAENEGERSSPWSTLDGKTFWNIRYWWCIRTLCSSWGGWKSFLYLKRGTHFDF